uniref:Uncharacterized protein n=1 Tax=Ditylenchus dipsaci TaxID=166011 RepID=A0A915EHX3_9BILA
MIMLALVCPVQSQEAMWCAAEGSSIWNLAPQKPDCEQIAENFTWTPNDLRIYRRNVKPMEIEATHCKVQKRLLTYYTNMENDRFGDTVDQYPPVSVEACRRMKLALACEHGKLEPTGKAWRTYNKLNPIWLSNWFTNCFAWARKPIKKKTAI